MFLPPSQYFRSQMAWLFSATALTCMLGACGSSIGSKFYETVTGERPAQPVEGGRRRPPLNPSGNAMAAPGPGASMEMPRREAPVPPSAAYIPPPPAALPSAPMEHTEIRTSESFTSAVPAGDNRRQVIPGNPSPASSSTEDSALSGPLASEPVAAMNREREDKPSLPWATSGEATAPSESRPMELLADKEKPPPSAEDRASDYPLLSSVPEKPYRFRQIHAGRQEMERDLRDEHSASAEQREAVELQALEESALADVPPAPVAPAEVKEGETLLTSMSDRDAKKELGARPSEQLSLQTSTLGQDSTEPAMRTEPLKEQELTVTGEPNARAADAEAVTSVSPPPAEKTVARAPAKIAAAPDTQEEAPVVKAPVAKVHVPEYAPVAETEENAADAEPAQAPVLLTPPEVMLSAPTRFLPDSRYAARRAGDRRDSQH